ncbi:zinc metallopeptidase [Clostridium sp. ZS2-4]|uniref:zinc metallopeptidase n=1 Tax=Clostridium sp. ZS2-4 TaxID=2987703 RepID=UPI00227C7390|nr:zinc metallopeptidase [Clostridium sp. ZS2-4]MCY6356733.1 zinc metallopeptidase [Clostridium sp. ZS2-4]
MFFYDSTMLILIPALIISAWAQMKVKSTFDRYSRVRSINGYTGAQVARMMLDAEGLYDVPVQQISGRLTDHYDPKARVMRLSTGVFDSTSVAAIGVAAHETGHAIQHQRHYAPLQIRSAIVPVVNLSSNASWIIFLLGFILGLPSLVSLGVYLFGAVVIFQLITLPVEFDASNRALKIIGERGILYGDEIKGAKSVLSAAALTYVAAALMAISQLIRLLAISRDR